MSYNAEMFVNANAHNFAFAVEPQDEDDMFEVYPDLFAQQNNVVYDVLNQQADPVFIYELAGVPVAWYDCENAVGFIL